MIVGREFESDVAVADLNERETRVLCGGVSFGADGAEIRNREDDARARPTDVLEKLAALHLQFPFGCAGSTTTTAFMYGWSAQK